MLSQSIVFLKPCQFIRTVQLSNDLIHVRMDLAAAHTTNSRLRIQVVRNRISRIDPVLAKLMQPSNPGRSTRRRRQPVPDSRIRRSIQRMKTGHRRCRRHQRLSTGRDRRSSYTAQAQPKQGISHDPTPTLPRSLAVDMVLAGIVT